jgi:hypothetical protein
MDLLGATHALYGDCSQTPPSTEIYIGETLATDAQMIAITAKATEMQASYDSQSYARARKAEYDALNQFELISDDSANSTTTHADAIAAIKAKYPKP